MPVLACDAVPLIAQPHLATRFVASPNRRCETWPDQALPCRTKPYLRCRAIDRLVGPHPACNAAPGHAKPGLGGPCLACYSSPNPALPCLDVSVPAVPRLRCLCMPSRCLPDRNLTSQACDAASRHTSPCRPCLCPRRLACNSMPCLRGITQL